FLQLKIKKKVLLSLSSSACLLKRKRKKINNLNPHNPFNAIWLIISTIVMGGKGEGHIKLKEDLVDV
ncbi:MAG: hypothetical protein AAB636_00650, partial [Patescibacteria group bacterium]